MISTIQSSVLKDPARSILNDDVFPLGEGKPTLVHDSNQCIFWAVDWPVPESRCGLITDRRNSSHGVQRSALIANDRTVGIPRNRAWRETNLPVGGISAKEAQVYSTVARCLHIVTHLP